MTAVAEVRAGLYLLAEQIRADIESRVDVDYCARSREWLSMATPSRMAVVLLAGMDGDLMALSKKRWHEFSPDEKTALQVALRSLFADLLKTYALRLRAG